MAIPNETIVGKMMDELKKAQLYHENHRQMVKHIENVRLLSDLIIDGKQVESEGTQTGPKSISADEMKAMFGTTETKKDYVERESETDEDDANGKSIFDF